MKPAIPRLASLSLAAALCSGVGLPGQEVLHYRFDGGCGAEIQNLGTAQGSGLLDSDLVGAPAAGRVAGRFGRGLAPGQGALRNQVLTGWNPGNYTGSFTLAFHASLVGTPAQAVGVPVPFGHICGTNGLSLRCSLGGGGAFRLDWGLFGGPDHIVMAQDVSNRMRSGWVHVAFVVNSVDNTASVYVDGVLDHVQALAATPGWFGTAFVVGNLTSVGHTPSPVALDEFLLATRPLGDGEVLDLATSPLAGSARFGSGCGAVLRVKSGRPALGGAVVLEIADPIGDGWLLYGGTSRCRLPAGPPLPFDLGSIDPRFGGCEGLVSLDLATSDGAGGFVAGLATVNVQVPVSPQLSGLQTHWQAVVGRTTGALRTTNGVTASLGH